MTVNRKRALYYSFFLLFIMACRTYACSTQQLVVTEDSVADSIFFTCQQFTHLGEGPGTSGYTCVIPCPTVGNHTFDIFENKTIFASMTLAEAQAKYCPASPSASKSVAPTEEPTEAPTEAPAPTEPPVASAPLQPYLTGNFTTCDNVSRYVNFTIADPAAPFDPATHKVLFNGVEATCTRAASAFDVLTCIYPPAPYGPPAIIEVFIGEERVNEFKFDGGKICDPAQNPNPPGTEEPSNPAPTEPPATEPAPTEDTGGD